MRVRDVHSLVAVADLGAEGNWGGVRSVAVGPEGGWAHGEWGESRRRVGLGPTVLRTETAGVVAASLLRVSGRWLGLYPGRRTEMVMMRALDE